MHESFKCAGKDKPEKKQKKQKATGKKEKKTKPDDEEAKQKKEEEKKLLKAAKKAHDPCQLASHHLFWDRRPCARHWVMPAPN
jgi:hypothetical protein